jgi:hypothetical protein
MNHIRTFSIAFDKTLVLCPCIKPPFVKVFLGLQNPMDGDDEDLEHDDGGNISIMKLIVAALWKENIYKGLQRFQG